MSARTKVILSILVIIFGCLILFSLAMKNKMQIQTAKSELKLISAVKTARVGEPFKFSIFFKTDTKDVASFDAVVSYDPEIVRVDEIKTSNIFPLTTRKLIEDFKNRFIVTGVQTDLAQQLSVAEGELAEITATPLQTGKATFAFIVDGRKYTNLTGRKVDNIIFKSNSLEVEIVE